MMATEIKPPSTTQAELPRPRLAVIVHNGIDGDSRVLKTAIAAGRAGWDVLLLGVATSGVRSDSWLGSVRVTRIPLSRVLFERMGLSWAQSSRSRLLPSGVRRKSLRLLKAMLSRLPHTSRSAQLLRKIRTRLERATQPTVKADWLSEVSPEQIEWRRDWPIFNDWWLTFTPELAAFDPDVIHANDPQMIGVAARYVQDARLHGRPCHWVYDSHEYVPAVDWGGPQVSAAYVQHEAEFIGRADAVVTVSREIATRLQDAHGLAPTPLVVANAPIAGIESDVSVRAVCGLDESAPLLVYSGVLAQKRGVDLVVRALAELPGVHLVVVCSGKGEALERLRDLAVEVGVADRFHVALYVAPALVPSYLSSADVALSPHRWDPNHDSSLPTKTMEYLHARLPLVASDMKVTKAFLAETGVGETFVREDVADLAATLRKVLADLPKYRAAITEDLLAAHSWQQEVARLTALYSQTSGFEPEPRVIAWDVEETSALSD